MIPLKVMLDIQGVSHAFDGVPVLHDVNIRVMQGEVVAIVGPTGCGKSTLLAALLGTIPIDQGSIVVDGHYVVEPGRERGNVSQSYDLPPFNTAEKNVALGPLLEGTSLPTRFFFGLRDIPLGMAHRLGWFRDVDTLTDPFLRDARWWLDRVGLGNAYRLFPGEMSGGMRQRCAIAQALNMRPKVLAMDEPFGALDARTRRDCQGIISEFYCENLEEMRADREPPYTIVLVTHDRAEAIRIADRVIALSQFHPLGERGATVVYDAATPNFDPHDPVAFDFPKAVMMERDIEAAAMDPQNRGDKKRFLTFWRDAELGLVKGIFAGRKVETPLLKS